MRGRVGAGSMQAQQESETSHASHWSEAGLLRPERDMLQPHPCAREFWPPCRPSPKSHCVSGSLETGPRTGLISGSKAGPEAGPFCVPKGHKTIPKMVPDFGPVLDPRTGPEWTRNGLAFWITIRPILDQFWGPVWIQFGTHLGPSSGPFRVPFWVHFGSRVGSGKVLKGHFLPKWF